MKNFFRLPLGAAYLPALCLSLVLMVCSCGTGKSAEEALPIPRAGGIRVDGAGADWEGKGLLVPLVSNQYGETAPGDFAASAKLAWDTVHLYVLVEVSDDALVEEAGPLRGDGMEIFLSQERGSHRMVQYIIAPGVTSDYPEPRIDKFDYAEGRPESDVRDIRVASAPGGSGYCMELAIPWKALGITAEEGSRWALNFYLGDVDPGERKVLYSFYFNQNVWGNRHALREVVLSADEREMTEDLVVKAWIEDRQLCCIRVLGESGHQGERILVRAGGQVKARAGFEPRGDFEEASVDLIRDSFDEELAALVLVLPGRKVRTLCFRDMPLRYVHTEKLNRFEENIIQFEETDKLEFPPAGGVVFIGSSSIARWEGTIGEDFRDFDVICRGFGGSTTADALYYFDRIALPYDPAVIVLAEGSNDLGRGELPEEVVNLTEQFILRAAEALPDATVLVLSVKVSVSRKRLVETVMETNALLKEMIAGHDNAEFVDVTSGMLTPEGLPRPEIFVADSTHMNRTGYALWTQILNPCLEKYSLKPKAAGMR